MSGFEKLLYRLVNRVVALVLRSPLHGLVSRRILLLTFVGRRSGRTLAVPLNYVRVDGYIVCFTGPAWSAWWKNGAESISWLITRASTSASSRLTSLKKPGTVSWIPI